MTAKSDVHVAGQARRVQQSTSRATSPAPSPAPRRRNSLAGGDRRHRRHRRQRLRPARRPGLPDLPAGGGRRTRRPGGARAAGARPRHRRLRRRRLRRISPSARRARVDRPDHRGGLRHRPLRRRFAGLAGAGSEVWDLNGPAGQNRRHRRPPRQRPRGGGLRPRRLRRPGDRHPLPRCRDAGGDARAARRCRARPLRVGRRTDRGRERSTSGRARAASSVRPRGGRLLRRGARDRRLRRRRLRRPRHRRPRRGCRRGRATPERSTSSTARPHGLSTAPGTTANAIWTQGDLGSSQDEASDEFGHALAAGDWNDDGRDDLAVGAPRENWGEVIDAGAVFVILGSDDGLTALGQQVRTQDDGGNPGRMRIADDHFGSSLACRRLRRRRGRGSRCRLARESRSAASPSSVSSTSCRASPDSASAASPAR
jgi:hypothetical protein